MALVLFTGEFPDYLYWEGGGFYTTDINQAKNYWSGESAQKACDRMKKRNFYFDDADDIQEKISHYWLKPTAQGLEPKTFHCPYGCLSGDNYPAILGVLSTDGSYQCRICRENFELKFELKKEN